VQIRTDTQVGHAVTCVSGGSQYLIMDAGYLAAANSLQITPVWTSTPVSYRQMQIAQDAPLVRFQTDDTNLFCLAMSERTAPGEETSAGYWLFPTNLATTTASRTTVPADALAFTGAQTNLIGVVCSGSQGRVLQAIPAEADWVDVGPAQYRHQTKLLAVAGRQRKGGPLSPAMVKDLETTAWLTRHLRQSAAQLLSPK
jgi:hypothetical protein